MVISWSTKRQLIYLGGILGIILVVVLIYLFPIITKKSTCFDNAQNGGEAGVDCGGNCLKYCPFQVNAVVNLWSRSYMVAPNIYNAVAYVQNQNLNAGIPKISYEFSLYDENNIFIAKRVGETYIGPNNRTAIFEAGINVGNRIPKYTTLKFVGSPEWYKVPAKITDVKLFFKEQELNAKLDNPKLTAILQNNSIYDVDNLDIIAILYDKDEIAVASSKTFVSKLDKNSSKDLFFVWPQKFSTDIVRIELLPRYDIFALKF